MTCILCNRPHDREGEDVCLLCAVYLAEADIAPEKCFGCEANEPTGGMLHLCGRCCKHFCGDCMDGDYCNDCAEAITERLEWLE